jgi:hypothetical protein
MASYPLSPPFGVGDPTRQDTWTIRVHLNGNTTGIWDKKTGGELDSEETKYSPGGMAPQLSLGGRHVPGNVTLQRIYDLHNDHDHIQEWLGAVGKGQVDVFSVPMDVDGNVYGQPIQHSGILKKVAMPDIDSESSSAAMLEIEVSIGTDPVQVKDPGR